MIIYFQVIRSICTGLWNLQSSCLALSFRLRVFQIAHTVCTRVGRELCASLLIYYNQTRLNSLYLMSLTDWTLQISNNDDDSLCWLAFPVVQKYVRTVHWYIYWYIWAHTLLLYMDRNDLMNILLDVPYQFYIGNNFAEFV